MRLWMIKIFLLTVLSFFSMTLFAVSKETVVMGVDQHLGLPIKSKTISLSKNYAIRVIEYSNVENLVSQLNSGKIKVAFVPVGVLFYLHSLKSYSILASARSRLSHGGTEQSYILVNQSLSSKKLPIGYINQYCTTSYFAPLLYFVNHNLPTNSLQWVKVSSFQSLLDNLVQRRLAIAAEWEFVVSKNMSVINNLKIIGKVSKLPTPIIVVNKQLPVNFSQQLLRFLLAHGFASIDSWGYSGFMKPNQGIIKHFMKTVCAIQNKSIFELSNCSNGLVND